LVGGITTMPEYAPFPPYKDVDFHMIFAEGSPALAAQGPFSNNIEVLYSDLMLEGGFKSVQEYRSAAEVLSNPEIAHHLMVEQSILYDPSGLLQRLHGRVAREFAYQTWVTARIEHERQGLQRALAMVPMARQMGASFEASVLGYSFTFLSALLCIATLRAPTTGSRSLLRMREVLVEYGRMDLYEEALTVLGVAKSSPARVAQFLRDGIEAFDLAVTVIRTPHPASHKLHAHLRPYFVAASESLIQEGNHREALHWLFLFYLAACDVLLVDGPEERKPYFAGRAADFLEEIGMESPIARITRWEAANNLYDRFFALAEEIVAQHPGILA
jgi:hypothetical protein